MGRTYKDRERGERRIKSFSKGKKRVRFKGQFTPEDFRDKSESDDVD